MSYTVDKISDSEEVVTFNIEASEVTKAYDAAYKEVSAKAVIKGFRKGHIPQSILLREYSADIENRAFNKIYSNNIETYFANISYESILDIKNVKFNNQLSRGKNLSYSVTVIHEPLFIERDISDVKVELVEYQISDSDIDDTIDTIRKNYATYKQVEDENAVVADDSRVNIDFVGKDENNVEFQGGSAKNFNVTMNRNHMIPGFSEQLIGHKVGDKFTINCQFPDDYKAEELKGKKATFDITINAIETLVVPELNDEFAKNFEVENMELLRESLKNNIVRQANEITNNINQEALFNAIAEKYSDIELPELLCKKYAHQVFVNRLQSYIQNNEILSKLLKQKEFEKRFEEFYEKEKEQMKKSTLQNFVARSYFSNIDLDDAVVDAKFKEIVDIDANMYTIPDEFKEEINSKKGELYNKYISAARSLAFNDELLKKVQVTYKNISWEELSKHGIY